MADLIQLVPMKLLFVAVFGFLPICISVYERGIDDISSLEWLSYAVLAGGAVLTLLVAERMSSVEMQKLIWPLLGIMGVGLLLYRVVLESRGEFDQSEIERGGTSYDD